MEFHMAESHAVERFQKTEDILCDMKAIIDSARETAHKAVNTALVQRNWLIGYRIAEEELRAEIAAQKTMFYLKQREQRLWKEESERP